MSALALLATLFAAPLRQDGAQGPAASDTAAALHPLPFSAIEERLVRASTEHPRTTRLITIGTSAGGRPLHVLVLTDLESGAPETKPGLFVAGYRGWNGARDAELVLAVAERLLAGADDAAAAALLAHDTLYLAPALDPDACEPRLGPETNPPAFDKSFPIGWLPEGLRPGSGSMPLSRPETLATAQFLSRTPSLVALLTVRPETSGGGAGWPQAALPELDARVFQRMVERVGAPELLLSPWDPADARGGGLADYAYQALGIYPFAWRQPAEAGLGAELGAWLDAASARTLELARRLPRVRFLAEAPARLGPGVWQWDLEVVNDGDVPTSSALGRERSGARGLEFRLEGARLVACAERSSPSQPYRVSQSVRELQRGSFRGAALAGGERRWLRLVVEAPSASEIGVVAQGPWLASSRFRTTLP